MTDTGKKDSKSRQQVIHMDLVKWIHSLLQRYDGDSWKSMLNTKGKKAKA